MDGEFLSRFKLRVFFLGLAKKMWPRVTAYALFGLASAFLAFFFRDRLPDNLAYTVSPETVRSILTILASSMLAVTTFSLTVMVSAYASATTSVSPRATQLVVQDHTAQNVLSTFLGTFVFSLVGIIAINAEVYQDKGRLVLFVTTLCVTAIMLVTLIRWIDKLTGIGRVGETTRLVEEAACKALTERAGTPCLGCQPLTEPIPPNLASVLSPCYGYVQFIDTDDLAKVAEAADCNMYLTAMPGDFVTPQSPLAMVSRPLEPEIAEAVHKEFTIGGERVFEQDPRFGICVLAEIAQRSLPPAANDAGTVLDVLGRLVTVLGQYADTKPAVVQCERLWAPPLSIGHLFADAFDAIIRDGASVKQVQMRIHTCLGHLHRMDNEAFKKYALEYSALAVSHSDASALLPSEKAALRNHAAASVGDWRESPEHVP